MLVKTIFIILVTFFAGLAVSAGTFAFLFVIGVVPRMLRATNLMDQILTIENCIVLGVVFGNVMSLWERSGPSDPAWAVIPANAALIVYGISAGIFVGCIAVALAEILDTFPITFRRLKLAEGKDDLRGTTNNGKRTKPVLVWMMFSMAFGKLVGSLFSLLCGYNF